MGLVAMFRISLYESGVYPYFLLKRDYSDCDQFLVYDFVRKYLIYDWMKVI